MAARIVKTCSCSCLGLSSVLPLCGFSPVGKQLKSRHLFILGAADWNKNAYKWRLTGAGLTIACNIMQGYLHRNKALLKEMGQLMVWATHIRKVCPILSSIKIFCKVLWKLMEAPKRLRGGLFWNFKKIHTYIYIYIYVCVCMYMYIFGGTFFQLCYIYIYM